ncbi:nibrin [Trichonephila clavipes]|uniref:Nibrin n=1 Tax=Trichonephila clavipes TaxID=2585209 RepID=A0A8X6VFK6_TRICX|nr:nibrin [Trichonephila clavipes]
MEVYVVIQRDACPDHRAFAIVMVDFSDIGLQAVGLWFSPYKSNVLLLHSKAFGKNLWLAVRRKDHSLERRLCKSGRWLSEMFIYALGKSYSSFSVKRITVGRRMPSIGGYHSYGLASILTELESNRACVGYAWPTNCSPSTPSHLSTGTSEGIT